MQPIEHRYDFVYLFDVTDGNPNGDPDAGNLPRLDPETNQGLVSDVCLKRKVRDYVHLLGRDNCEIFVQQRRPLNPLLAEACHATGKEDFRNGERWNTRKAKNRSQSDIAELQRWLCRKYFDIRTFGAVMSTGPNAGQIRGPVQMTFARSVDPIFAQEHTITRVADVDKEEGEMGRKHIVPYGLYRGHGFISAHLAGDAKKGTGFSQEDLELFWTALEQMFEHDRSAARGEMTARGLIVFKHESALGNALAHRLFERVAVTRNRSAEEGPARSFADYAVSVDSENLPAGVELIDQMA